MGRKDKEYSKDMHQQAYDKLIEMLAFGRSKKEDMKYDREYDTDIVSTKIYSFSTYKTYRKHVMYFIAWIQREHPDITVLKKAKKYVPEWLQTRVDAGLSAWTVQTEAAALNKLYQIKPDDPERFQPPKRSRENIKRSRTDAVRDKHFSVTNNDELIKFCKGTGLRRAGMGLIKGKDLMTREQIEAEIKRIEAIPADRRTNEEQTRLIICKDTRIFTDPNQIYFVHTREKGGRERISPIIGPNTEQIVKRFKATALDENVWQHVPKNADIHGYRGDYATLIYKAYARKIEDIPYDRVNKGTGKRFQSDVYTCRKDESGRKLDKHAMLVCSKALGHNRIEVVANNYIRGL